MDENHVVWLIVREYMADYMSLTEANQCGTTAFTWHAKKLWNPLNKWHVRPQQIYSIHVHVRTLLPTLINPAVYTLTTKKRVKIGITAVLICQRRTR